MKERNLLVFITALVASILLVISICLKFFIWYDVNDYGLYASIPTTFYLIPVVILWLGWYLDDIKSVVIASAIMTINLYFHLEHVGVLNGNPLLVTSYAPMIKTVYVLNLVLMVATIISGFVSYYLPKFNKKEA
ncbi:MAG: hypothetical protein WCR19_02315 [Acholeplasmataceae bacterium]